MSRNCKIFLENYDGVYIAGSEIKGRLECFFETDITIRELQMILNIHLILKIVQGIKIFLKCKERNRFKRGRRGRKTKKTTILNEEQLLFGSESETRVVEGGTHIYPFSFELRHDIPSTFTSHFNTGISYKIKGVVDVPFAIDYKDELTISVFSPIDLNILPRDLQEPRTYSKEKSFGFCCDQGELAMSVELPKLAFLIGEVVNFKVIVSNMSYLSVNRLRIKLEKKVTANMRRKSLEEIVSFTEHGIGAHNLHTFSLQLAIPADVNVSNFSRCTMFKETYKLKVSCVFEAAFTRNLSVSIYDIVLGHVPFRDYV